MAKNVAARTITLRKQLLGILLAQYPHTVPTGEIQRRLTNDGHACGDPRPDNPGCRRAIGGHIAANDCCGGCWYLRAYPQLVALTKMQLVERSWPGGRGGQRQTHWRYLHDDQSDAYFNAIVSAMDNNADAPSED